MRALQNFPVRFRHLSFGLCLLFVSVLAIPVSAQPDDDNAPPDLAPPPLKILAKEEKVSLEKHNSDIKKRTKTAIELMDVRLLKAERFQAANNYQETLVELAGFNAILDNSLDFMLKNDKGKSDRSFINLEIYLRKLVPRLETIRREMPVRYGYYIGKLMKALREARAKAVEPLFEDSVVPDNTAKKP